MARVIVPKCPHHIVQRGHNRNAVFVSDEDYEYYLSTLFEWKVELQIKVYAFCLMTNHVHLVLDPGTHVDSIGFLMKRLAGRQTRYVNKKEGRTGSLWEGRYKTSPIDTESYLMRCCRYVELNPVKAKMVRFAEDYRWSSYQAKIGASGFNWVDFDVCYLGLDDRKNSYKAFVESGIAESEQVFIQNTLERNQLTGGGAFVDEIERRIGIRIEHRKQGRPKNNSDR